MLLSYMGILITIIRIPINQRRRCLFSWLKWDELGPLYVGFFLLAPSETNLFQATYTGYISIKIEWDFTNVHLSKLLELVDTQVDGVRSVGPVGDFLEYYNSTF